MSTLESTIFILKMLPEDDLIEVKKFAEEFFNRRNFETTDSIVGRSLKPMSEEDFLEDINTSEQQFVRGEYQDATEFLAEIRHEYGI